MYGWERLVLLKHLLEQGLSKTAIARQLGVSRRVDGGRAGGSGGGRPRRSHAMEVGPRPVGAVVKTGTIPPVLPTGAANGLLRE